MGELRNGYCLCKISRWNVQWRSGWLCKGFKNQPWHLVFIDDSGEFWYLDGEYSFVDKSVNVPVGKILSVNTFKI